MASNAHHAPDRRFVRTQRIQSNVQAKGLNFRPGSIHCRAARSRMSIAHNADQAIALPSGYRQPQCWQSSELLLPPPLWGRVGAGGRAVGHCCATSPDPHPRPSPQGGGEEFAAPSRLNLPHRRSRPQGVHHAEVPSPQVFAKHSRLVRARSQLGECRLMGSSATSFRTSRKSVGGRRRPPHGLFCPASGPMSLTP